MKIDTFMAAQELHNRYVLCERIMEYLSDPDKTRGMKYKELLAKFAEEFGNDFMMFVHTKMEESGMAFEELSDCDCDKQPEENPEPTEPKEPKFPIGSLVVIVTESYKGRIGTVVDFDTQDGAYYVKSDFNGNGNQFSMWFTEVALKAYAEESEEPTPDDKYEIVYGTRVRVKSGEYAGKVGTIIDVMVGFTKILVQLDDVEEPVEFTPDELAKYTDPENTEANGGADTPDEGE